MYCKKCNGRVFVDRVFSQLSNMELFNEEEHEKYISKLGIDIFTKDFTKQKFKEKVKSKKMILASFLLNQDIFCGIGNYIKNEVLYMGNLDIKIKTNELTDNQIEELPIHLLNLRSLISFNYTGNPIENISLPVQRWLDRLNRRITKNNQVYSDTQNIHNSNIQKSFRSSLENIMKDKLSRTIDECKNALLTSQLTEEVKREILNYCDDKTEHSIYLITFEDLFHYVMNRILIHSESSEILKILEEEIKDTICKCFTGRMTRLLNVLNGFYPDIQIQIGSNEQITNVILMLKDKYEGEELKEKVREELKERGYEESVIEEWISFIE